MNSKQNDALAHLSEWKVGALFMEAGTGKTRVAMEIVNRTPCDAVIWVAPLRTIENAKVEVSKWGGFGIPVKYYGVESISASDRIYLELLADVEGSANPFVVVDESLKIKNADTKRTKRMLEIGRMVQYKLILNGTPLSRNLLDLWAQMEFLSPLILKMSLQQFKNTFCEYKTVTRTIGRSRYSREYITGYDNIDYLFSLIRHYVYKCDLSLQISQYYHELVYTIGEDEKREYGEIKDFFLRDETLEWKQNNIYIEMTQKMQHSYCCTESKFEVLDHLFKSIRQSDTIIFCKYIKSRAECERRYPAACVLSYQKSALGLNLQQYHNTIYFDKIFDYALREQSSRRTYRTGQEIDCQYYDLTGDVGLEKVIDKNISNKISMIEYFKGKTKEEVFKEL